MTIKFGFFKYNNKNKHDYVDYTKDKLVKIRDKALDEKLKLKNKLLGGGCSAIGLWAAGAFIVGAKSGDVRTNNIGIISFSNDTVDCIVQNQINQEAIWFIFTSMTIIVLLAIIYCCYIYSTEYKSYVKDIEFYDELIEEMEDEKLP